MSDIDPLEISEAFTYSTGSYLDVKGNFFTYLTSALNDNGFTGVYLSCGDKRDDCNQGIYLGVSCWKNRRMINFTCGATHIFRVVAMAQDHYIKLVRQAQLMNEELDKIHDFM